MYTCARSGFTTWTRSALDDVSFLFFFVYVYVCVFFLFNKLCFEWFAAVYASIFFSLPLLLQYNLLAFAFSLQKNKEITLEFFRFLSCFFQIYILHIDRGISVRLTPIHRLFFVCFVFCVPVDLISIVVALLKQVVPVPESVYIMFEWLDECVCMYVCVCLVLPYCSTTGDFFFLFERNRRKKSKKVGLTRQRSH